MKKIVTESQSIVEIILGGFVYIDNNPANLEVRQSFSYIILKNYA